MRNNMFKWTLVIGLSACFQMTDIMTVYGNDVPLDEVWLQW